MQRFVKEHGHARVDAERAHPADRVADLRLDLVERQHLGLAAKARLVFRVVDLGVARGDDQDDAVVRAEGQGFGDARGLTADGLRGQFDGGRGGVELEHASVRAEPAQPVFCFFDGHSWFPPV